MKQSGLALIFTLIILLLGCSNTHSSVQPISETTLQFGTIIQITVFDENDSDAVKKTLEHMEKLDQALSANIQTSEVSQFNELKANVPFEAGPHLQAVIEKGLFYSELSDGYFDITIEPIVTEWGIGSDHAHVPTTDTIESLLPFVNYKYIHYDPEKHILTKSKDQVKIDLGAIAKGYAADEAMRILKENKVKKALINLGGNVYALGDKDENMPWTVGIQDPRDTQGAMIGTVTVSNEAVITSGIYERYFEQDGKRYHHILNPLTGYPIDNTLLGVSVITSSGIDGDALSTVVYTKGLEDGLDFVESLVDTEAIFVTKDNHIYVSSGLTDNFILTNSTYQLK